MYLTDNGPQMIQRSENMELQMFPQKAFMIESHAGSWQHPYPFQRWWWAQNNFYLEPAENVEKLASGGGWGGAVLHLVCCQDPSQTMDEQHTGGLVALLCLDKAGQSPKFLFHRKICWIFWAWQLKIDATLGPLPIMTMKKSGVAVYT